MATPLNKSILEVLFNPATPKALRTQFGRNISSDLTDELVTLLDKFILDDQPLASKSFRVQQVAKRTDFVKKLTKPGGSLPQKKQVIRKNWSRLYRILAEAYDHSSPLPLPPPHKPVSNAKATSSLLVSSAETLPKRPSKSTNHSPVAKNDAPRSRKPKVPETGTRQ